MSKKFRDKLLVNSGISNQKVESDIGKKMMEKMGWIEGKGIGKNLEGTVDCIQIKKREENIGLGYSVKKDDNNNWWEALYNNNISNIKNTHIVINNNLSDSNNDSDVDDNNSISNYCSEDEKLFSTFSNIMLKKIKK